MKTLASYLFIVFITTSFFISLAPEMNFHYDQIGIEHNKGLDFVLAYLKSNEQKFMSKSYFKQAKRYPNED
ncbi:hypothetical protein KUV50_06560 [Membranicola marinus]|uniref:Uncharacterized protein n=1 Tax=Membranihabitans marinus TaxID=1227546 RepID=A0A953HTV3_9BACT|nr:hypothetical protein [Membranihabitans marinus]MBY5957783.1 hypothetical protein [Membranihabitans marinus]